MSRRWGTLWIGFGLLLLLGAAGLTLYNLHQDASAGQEADAVVEELAAVLAEKPAIVANPRYGAAVREEAPEPVEVDGRSYMGVSALPTLGLQLPVQEEWSYPNLKVSPCRMTGSAAEENLVILAHNYQSHFGTLEKLELGDEVSVTLLDGTVYLYQVSAKEIVEPTAVEDVTSGAWPLTLFTCTIGGKTRVVVRCDFAGAA